MLEAMKEILAAMVEDDELFALIAKGMKKAHAALVEEGFSSEDATTIIAGQGMGVKAG